MEKVIRRGKRWARDGQQDAFVLTSHYHMSPDKKPAYHTRMDRQSLTHAFRIQKQIQRLNAEKPYLREPLEGLADVLWAAKGFRQKFTGELNRSFVSTST